MNKSLVQQQFGAHAAAYVTSTVHAKGASLGRLVELVAPQPTWAALDVATGAGHTAAAFAPHVGTVIASDLTSEILEEAAKLAKSKGLANMETARADAEALPFADGQFDLVTCRIAPHHFPDVAAFAAGVWRVLKAGGTFALVDNIAPDALSTPGFSAGELSQAAQIYNAFEKVRDPSHARCLGMAEWTEVLSDRGFVWWCTRSACRRIWNSNRGPRAWAPMLPRSSDCARCSWRARRRSGPSSNRGASRNSCGSPWTRRS